MHFGWHLELESILDLITSAHAIAACLGPEKLKALPIFHAFTGCESVFLGRERKLKSMEHLADIQL